MASNNTVLDIRKRCRIVTETFDSEIGSYIDACIIDLGRVGITAISETDAIILHLISLYVKAALNFEQDGERYQRAYEYMRNGISLAGDYNGAVSENV